MAFAENVTVLFTDLVGSTELASALDPEDADELRRGHFSTLRQAIAVSGGREVKNLGDGLMVVFPAASAALACAVAMQQAVDRDNVGADCPLGLRVGLSTGEATRESEDYFGDPVIEASRLCARAEGGQILASDLVRATAGRRSSHVFSSLGDMQLKGLPEPIEAYMVGWEPQRADVTTAEGVPLPARLARRPTIGVIGRDGELTVLDAAAKRVASSEGREVVLVTGEPGLGKTTLVSELARRAHDDGFTVLFGRCDEEVGIPYRPFSEALSDFVAHADAEVLRAHVAGYGGELTRLVPSLRQRLGDLPSPISSDADTERYMLYGAVVGLIEAVCAISPVVLVLDDLHWADKPSLQLLRHVVANSSSARLLVLGTYRDAELSATHPLNEALARLHREPTGVSSIDLKGLDDTGVIAFMESAAGHELDDAGVGLAHELYRETDGNPFFVAEVLRNLSESGVIYQDATTGRWTAADPQGSLSLPHSVRSVIGTRVSRLGEEAIKVLSTASVIGREFDLDLLAVATDADEDALIDLLDEAHHAAVVQEVRGSPGRYCFSHALIQHTLYEDMGAARRARVHRLVGEAMERLYGEGDEGRVGELARHFLLATRPADSDKAISYARRAGEAALAALAPDEAVRFFSQALEVASHAPTVEPIARVDMLISLGVAQRQAGVAAFRETLLDAARRARELGDTGRLVAAALTNSRGFFSSLGQLDTDKVEILEAALHAVGDADSPQRARLLATLCSELTYHGTLDKRLVLADEAKAIARRLGDTATLVDVINRCATALLAPSTLTEEYADAAEAIAAATELDDPSRLFQAVSTGCTLAVRAGQFDVAAERLAIEHDLAQKLGQPSRLWTATFHDAARALLIGDADGAERIAKAALEVGTSGGQPDAFGFYAVQLMAIRYTQGRFGEVVPLMVDAARHNPAIPAFQAALGAAYLDAGDESEAREIIDQAAAGSFAVPENASWLDAMVNYARVVIELQLLDHAERLLELLAPAHEEVPHNGLIPQEPAAMYAGGLAAVLGRYDEAERYFDEAAKLNARGDMQFSEAHTNLLWGRMLRERGGPGDRERARELLENAKSSAATHRYAMVERRAAAELSKLSQS